MSVTFLYPLFWLGAVAIGAPIWLHLRRKAERSVVRFSAVRFLDDLPQAKSSPRRIEDPWLLLLRALAMLLLIAAFAWPYVPDRRGNEVSESRVYVLDNTLSHRAGGGFDRDRQRIADALRREPADRQIAVIELAGMPRVVADFGEPRELAIERLETLRPSFERGSYLAAFRLASSLLDKSLGASRRIELLGDNQANQWAEAATVAPFLHDVDVSLPAVDRKSLDNASVGRARPRRLYLGDKSLVVCDVSVVRTDAIRSAVIEIEVNGREVDRRTLKFADDSPLTTTISFQWEAGPRERIAGRIRIQAADDALDADDQAYFSLPEVREGRAVAVARSPFLRTALSPAVMQGRWSTRLVDDLDRLAPEDGLLDGETLVIESRFLLAPAGRELVDAYLNRERGVLLLVDHVAPPVQAYLRGHGVEFRSIVDQPVGAASFRYVQTDHPIFQPFRSQDFGNLLDVRVHRYRRLAAPAASTLVYSQHGDLLLAQTDRTQGKLLVASFGFERAETNWPLQPTFVPFLDLCLEYLRAKPALQGEFEPGEKCVWSLPDDLAGDQFVLRSGDRELLRQELPARRVEFAAPTNPGLYQVSFDGGNTIAHELSVNPNPLESELTYEDARSAVETWKTSTSTSIAGTLTPSEELSRSEIFRQTVWWWLLIGGVLFLGLELIWEMLGLSSRRAGKSNLPRSVPSS